MKASRSWPSRNDTCCGVGQLRGREGSLHHDLVHRDRRTEHPRTDVRQVGELEQPLHGAVLSIRTVQQRQHDVDVERGARTGGRVAQRIRDQLPDAFRERAVDRERGRQRVPARLDRGAGGVGEQPRPVGGDRHRHDLVPVGVERTRHRDGGRARHVVLSRPSAVEEQNAQPTRHHDTCSTARIPRPMMKRPTRP